MCEIKRRRNCLFFTAVIGLAASVPFLYGYGVAEEDMAYYLQRTSGVRNGLLCIPGIFRSMGLSAQTGFCLYGVLLSFAAAGISCYCFSRIFESSGIGIVCSALYTLSAFRTCKLVLSGALGESTAAVFLPLVLYGLYRIFTEEPSDKRYRTAWIPLMLGLGGVLQSHLVSWVITLGGVLLFCLLFIRRVFRRGTFLALMKGAAGSLLISIWFWIPLLVSFVRQEVHMHYTPDTIQSRGLYPAQLAFHFWMIGTEPPGSENGMQYAMPMGVGLVLLSVLGIFLILWFSGAFSDGRQDKSLPFARKAAVVGGIFLLMSLKSFPWDKIQSLCLGTAKLVNRIQLPDRFLGWGTLCLVFLSGFCMRWFMKHNRRLLWGMAVAAAICVFTSDLYLLDYAGSSRDAFCVYGEEDMVYTR